MSDDVKVKKGEKFLYAAREDFKNKDGEVVVKQFDLVIGVLEYSENKKTDYFEIFTNADEIKKKMPKQKCSTKAFYDNFGLLPMYPKSYWDRVNSDVENVESAALDLVGKLENATQEIEEKDKEIDKLKKEITSLKAPTPEKDIVDRIKKSIADEELKGVKAKGLFTGLEEATDGELKAVNFNLIKSGLKLKGEVVINSLPALKIGGTAAELDTELLSAIQKLYGDNSMLIMNVNEYSKALEEKAAELKKEVTKTATAAKKEAAKTKENTPTEKKKEDLKAADKKEEKPAEEKKEEKSPELFEEGNKGEAKSEDKKAEEKPTEKKEEKPAATESASMTDDDW